MKRVVDVALCCKGKMLLCLEEVSHCPGELYWIPPGGKVEPNESDEAAILRELNEELGITVVMLVKCGVALRPYRVHQGDWFGDQMVVQHFVAELNVLLPFELRVGQLDACWASTPPAGGLVFPFTEALMTSLRLDGYLHQ